MSRKRYIPANSVEQTYDDANAVAYLYESAGRYYAIGYSGRRTKHDFHYKFNSIEKRGAYLVRWSDRKRDGVRATKDRRAFRHSLKVGQIVYSSWGYEQTNINFYEVVELKGSTMVVLREVAQDREYTEQMAGTCMPIPGEYVAEPFSRRVKVGHLIGVNSCQCASIWAGTPKQFTSYA